MIVVDDEDRENEGDLTIAAEKVTPEIINFMVTHGRGLVCLAMTPERLDALEIPLEVPVNSSLRETAMCVSIDARGKTSTGISAADRAATILTAIDAGHDAAGPAAARATCSRCARASGGVLVRAGHTEAAVDLARLAGLTPAGVICEIMTQATARWRACPSWRGSRSGIGLPLITIADLIKYRMQNERLVRAGRHGEAADRVRRVPAARLREPARSAKRTSRSCAARSATAATSWSACTRSASPGDVFHSGALRLRPAAAHGDAADRRPKGGACCCI